MKISKIYKEVKRTLLEVAVCDFYNERDKFNGVEEYLKLDDPDSMAPYAEVINGAEWIVTSDDVLDFYKKVETKQWCGHIEITNLGQMKLNRDPETNYLSLDSLVVNVMDIRIWFNDEYPPVYIYDLMYTGKEINL